VNVIVERSYHLYCEQYRRHLDEYMAFVSGVNWDMDRITVTVKGNVLTLTRPDKKRMRLNVQQVIGLLRYTGKRLQEIDEQETAT
jgi:hypothetical protein